MSFGGLSLRDIEYVVSVAATGSFTAAAEACGVAQPSLSAQVRKVERQLGIVLFERTGRSVRPTPAGAAVIEQARSVLGEARRMFDVARGPSDPLDGVLRLGVIATLGPYLIPHLIGPLRESFPRLRLVLHEGLTADLHAQVLAGELDAVLLSLPLDDERLAGEEVLFEPFVGMLPSESELAKRNHLELDDLDGADLILMEEGHCLRDQALHFCSTARPARHAASLETLRHLVAAGIGHSLLPRLAVSSAPMLDSRIRYMPLDTNVGRIIGLVWRGTDPRGAAYRRLAAFLAALPLPGVRMRGGMQP